MAGENRPDENSLYRLIEFQPIWKRYAVVENGERYHVIRILSPQSSEAALSPLFAAEEWASWLNPIESNESIPRIVRVVPHAEGVDVFTKMPLGISLKTLLHRVGPLRVPFVASILKTLVDALTAFHQGGHVHTSLCLDSVVIDDQGRLTLLDMGLRETLERCRGPISFPNPAWGSLYSEPSTTAPELIDGCKELSPLMDIFSLSSMTFHMLTGSTAYVGGDILEVYSLVQAGKTPEIEKYRRDLGPSLSQALVRGLSPQPGRRFEEVHELLEAVFGKNRAPRSSCGDGFVL